MLFETQWLFLLLQQFWRLDAMAQGAATLLGSGTLWFGVWMLSDEYGQSFAWFAACLLCLPCCSAAGLTLLASGVVEVEWLSTLFSSLRCDVPAMRNANSLDDENVDDDKDGDGGAVAAARRRRDVLNV